MRDDGAPLSDSDLRDCPFCAGPPETRAIYDETTGAGHYMMWSASVACSHCDAEVCGGEDAHKETAMLLAQLLWQGVEGADLHAERAAHAATRARLERLRETVMALRDRYMPEPGVDRLGICLGCIPSGDIHESGCLVMKVRSVLEKQEGGGRG
jgi:hypothetical protein